MDQNTPQNIQNTESTPDMKTLTCKVEKIVFHNEKNKYTVMSVMRDDGRHFHLLGNIDSVKENDALMATGSWNKDEKYGWQFKAETIEILSADDELDEREYIECKICEVRVLKAESGFASAKAECSDDSTVRLSGRLANVSVGSMIRAYGKWTHDEKYGDEFHVSKWEYQKEGESANPAEEEFPQLDSSSFVIPDTVTTIADEAFEGCENLLSVTIPDSVTSIGAGAFSGCKQLHTVALSNSIKEIEEQTFSGCKSLDTITIPDSVTSIGAGAFNGCKQLHTVNLPNSIEEIEEQTFSGCESLETITIPASVNRICKKAFEGCVKLSTIGISKAIDSIDKTAFKSCPSNIVYKTEEVDWEDITIIDKYIIISEPFGGELHWFDKNVNASMNSLLHFLSSKLPKLIVEYRINSAPVILNPEVLHDGITLLSVKNDFSGFVSSQEDSSFILDTFDKGVSATSRLFMPRDISPYVDFLYDKQEKEQYPIIPVEEYIGGSREEGALFTIIDKDQPFIVWENFNDARATYVFPCTRENYQERRQLLFDFIVTGGSGKRQFLRTDDCSELFGAKPMMLVHNNFESWSARLISKIETNDNNNKGNKMDDNKMMIYLWYKVDPEEIFDSYFGEMDVDEDGNYIMEYFEGSRVLLAERKIVVKEDNTLEVERKCTVESMSDDEYNNFIRNIGREERRRSHSTSDSKNDIFKDLCQQAVDMVDMTDPDEFSYALENDEIYVELRIDNSAVYSTSTCPSYDDEL